MRFWTLFSFLLAFTLTACRPPAEEAAVDETARVAADVATIDSCRQRLEAVTKSGDFAGWSALVADDAPVSTSSSFLASTWQDPDSRPFPFCRLDSWLRPRSTGDASRFC
jgi:hypothetical protein